MKVSIEVLKSTRDMILETKPAADTAPSEALKAWAYEEILNNTVSLLEATIRACEEVAA